MNFQVNLTLPCGHAWPVLGSRSRDLERRVHSAGGPADRVSHEAGRHLHGTEFPGMPSSHARETAHN